MTTAEATVERDPTISPADKSRIAEEKRRMITPSGRNKQSGDPPTATPQLGLLTKRVKYRPDK